MSFSAANAIQGMVLNPGSAAGEVIRLDEPLSFWGGYDPATGMVIDQHHPQSGVVVRQKILVLPSSRGSAGTPAGVAESIRTGHGPSAIVIGSSDVNIAIGAMVADMLYSSDTPVLAITLEETAILTTGLRVRIGRSGMIEPDGD